MIVASATIGPLPEWVREKVNAALLVNSRFKWRVLDARTEPYFGKRIFILQYSGLLALVGSWHDARTVNDFHIETVTGELVSYGFSIEPFKHVEELIEEREKSVAAGEICVCGGGKSLHEGPPPFPEWKCENPDGFVPRTTL